MKKRILSLMLVFALVFTLIPATAFAGTRSSGTLNGVKWELSDTGVLTISPGEGNEEYASGDMGDMDSYDYYTAWKYYSDDVKEIIINEGITRIGNYAFAFLYDAASVAIPDSVTEIGESAFANCAFTSVTVPSAVESIGNSAFSGCAELSSLTLREGLTTVGDYAFSSTGLTSIELPSSITSVGRKAFNGTPYMTEQENGEARFITSNGVLLKGNTDFWGEVCQIPEGITCIADEAFCDIRITSLVLPESLRYIGDMAFYGGHYGLLNCDMTATELDLKNVTHVGDNAFHYWYNLECVDLSNLEYIGNSAFGDCHDLIEVTLSDKLKHIGEEAFYKNYHSDNPVQKINMPEEFPNLEYADKESFDGTLPFREIMANSTDGFSYLGGILLYASPKTDIDYGNQITIKDGTRVIADHAFEYFSMYVSTPVTSLIVPDSVQSIGDISGLSELTDIYYAGDQESWNEVKVFSSTYDGYEEYYFNKLQIHCAKSSTVNIDSCMIELEYVETQYTGEIFKPAVTVTKDDGTVLVEGKDYKVGYAKTKNVGTGIVTIIGMGDYIGTVEKELIITKVGKSEISVKLSDDKFTYTSKNSQTPDVIATDRFGNTLIEGTDFTCTYSKKTRKSPGVYKITVKFKGNYSGSKTLSYSIVPGRTSTLKVDLSTATGGYNDAVLKWDVVPLASGYHVYYKKSTSKKWSDPINCKKKSIGNSYTKKNLADGVKYDFKVVAYYKDINTGKKYEAEKYKTASVYTLAKVKNVTVKKSSSSKIKVSWKKVSGADGYEVARMTAKKQKYTTKKTYTVAASKVSTTIKPTKGTKFYYRVRAYQKVSVDGKTKKVYGPWSIVKAYNLKK